MHTHICTFAEFRLAVNAKLNQLNCPAADVAFYEQVMINMFPHSPTQDAAIISQRLSSNFVQLTSQANALAHAQGGALQMSAAFIDAIAAENP